MKKIMLLEPNPYHSEVVPGVVKYLEDIGYVVDVYLRQEVKENKVFCRYNIKGNVIYFGLNEVTDIFQNDDIQQYDFLFLTSMEHSEQGKVERFLNEIDTIPNTKHGVLGIYHTNWLIDRFQDFTMQKQGRLFCLSDFQTKDYNISSVAPIFFVEDKTHQDMTLNRKKLLVIGGNSDFSLLYSAYWRLQKFERDNLDISYIGNIPAVPVGVKRIKQYVYDKCVSIYSLINPKYNKKKKIRQLHYFGRLNFDDMYREIENTDYLLVLIDPHTEKHNQYVSHVTSGIRQLILGFNKAAIIHDRLAEKYDLTKDSYIGFSENNLTDALRTAINMKPESYKEIEKNVQDCANYIYDKSLLNLKKAIDKLKEI